MLITMLFDRGDWSDKMVDSLLSILSREASRLGFGVLVVVSLTLSLVAANSLA